MRISQRLAFAGLAALAVACVAGAGPVHADEQCSARSISGVGRCHKRDFARRITDRELRGTTDSQSRAPDGVDPDLLATELAGALSVGQWYPVGGAVNQWALVVSPGEMGPAPGFVVQAKRGVNPPSLVALVQIVRDVEPDRPTVKLLARIDSLVAGTDADKKPDGETDGEDETVRDEQPVASAVPCIDPEASDGAEFDSGHGYPDISGQFHWLTLVPGHRVLVAGVSRSEGYAGGAGSFNGEVLFDLRKDSLVPVACHASWRYQMFGGDWNADGTRQHPESQAAWTLRVQPAAASRSRRWPDLALTPVTGDTPGGWLIWNAGAGHYVEAAVPARRRPRRR